MKNYLRYGYDPWMIGMTIVILIVEALGFFLGGKNAYDPFSNIPFWLLTLYIIAMIAMFLTACFIKNDALQSEKEFYKSPLTIVAIILFMVAIILGIVFEFIMPTASFYPTIPLTISIGIMGITRKNWISCFLTIIFTAIQIVFCFYLS